MNRILLGAAGLALLAGAANAQTAQGRSGAAQGPAGTNLASGGVTLLMPRVEIVPSPAGAVGAAITSPPPGQLQDKPGVSGMSGATIRRDLNGDGPGAAGGQGGAAGGGRAGNAGSGGGRGRDFGGGASGSDASAGLGTAGGAIDEQRALAQDQLRGTTGGVTASEGQRPNRVTGDRLDARQGRVGGETSGSVTGTGASVGRGAGAGVGSTGGARGSAGGGSLGGGRSGGGSSGGGSGGGGSGGGGR